MAMEHSASIDKPIPFSVLIVAGGSGLRLGGPIPKQYQKIGDNIVLNHTIKQFLLCNGLNQIRLVCDPDHVKWSEQTVHDFGLPTPSSSGKDRKSSVYNGLQSFINLKNEEIILIHDAARPFIGVEEIEALVKAVNKSGAATLAIPVSDTLRQAGTIVNREGMWAIQTPQGFHYGLIQKAHNEFRDRADFTDDASLVMALGHDVELVPGKRENFKITTMDDLKMAEKMMNTAQIEVRTGLGFDVHAFDPQKPGPIRLGGVDIPFEMSLSGHSDADVGLHAITDALLGAIAAGDIGQHFPPSDPQWKGADSAVFLKHAVDLVTAKNGFITLIDLTFMCEAPKIGPAREAMQRAIASITGLSPDRISIKATTTEKLGFTGRGEGIAAQALATVQFPL